MSMRFDLDDEHLAAAVEARPGLYDKTDKNYYNRDYARKQWLEIGQELDSDHNDCKNRWIAMRDYFHRKYKETLKGQNDKIQKKKRKWYLYDKLTFLIPSYEPKVPLSPTVRIQQARENLALLESTDHEEASSSFTSHLESPENNSKSDDDTEPVFFEKGAERKARRTGGKGVPEFNSADDELFKVLHQSAQIQSEAAAHSMDENELFLRSLLPSLKTLSRMKSMQFRHEVQGLLLRYLHEEEAGSSSDNLPVFPTNETDGDNNGGAGVDQKAFPP